MAVAGMNNVTVLESSFLGENYPPVTRRWGNQEKPISRTSYIRKMWRDLEGENRFREIERQQRSGLSSQSNTNTLSQCSCSSTGAESEDASITTSEVENECPRDHNQMEHQNVQEGNENLCPQRSPALCLADKQRVRQIFREWGSKNSSGHSHRHGHEHGHTSHKNNCSRVHGVCENECKRVRTVRQWIESNSREAETGRSIRRLYGRQALLDLLKRFEMERKQEIQSLLEKRPVSTFTHRNRIQSLLRGRFLWNQRFVQEEKSSSSAANELGLLRQTQTVSDLRKGFLSRLDSYEHIQDGPQYDTASDNSDALSDYHSENLQEQSDDIVNENDIIDTVDGVSQSHKVDSEIDVTETTPVGESHEQVVEDEGSHQLALTEFTETTDRQLPLTEFNETDDRQLALTEFVETSDENQDASIECQEPIVEDNGSEWHHLTDSESNEDLDLNSIENDEDEWYDDVSDDENGNRLELRELMSRRRVSNLLRSDFRERLDQVLQSYIERQDHASESNDDDWMETEDQNQSVDENDDVTEAVEGDVDGDSPIPAVAQTRQDDWRIVDELRVDMVNLQERMNDMQKTLETCMNMQLELQRSVKQEVSSALNREDRACFLCSDGGFDSSPDRGGHVYVCSKCAEKVDWSKIKESVRHP